MADIDLEQRRGGGAGWLWGILGLLGILLIAWWAWPGGDDIDLDTLESEPTAEVQPLPEAAPTADQPVLTVVMIGESPATYMGQTLSAEVTVTEVPTDRGFWIEEDGQRLFAIIIDQPQERPLHVQANTRVRLDRATVRDATYLSELPGAPLDADTEQIARDQEVFLVVDERSIHVVSEGQSQDTGEM